MVWVPILTVVLIGVPIGYLLSAPFQAVSRARLEKFARRQLLTIAPGNGNVVIGYLATTRRWRGTGLLAGVAIAGLHGWWVGDGLRLSGLGLFAGWFVGAVVAEWRVDVRGRGGLTRSASLRPRRAADYLPVHVRVSTPIAFVAVLAVEISAAAMVTSTSDAIVLCGWSVLTIGVAAAIALVTRHVLDRPQPQAESDVLEADDALRSRSLHVLAGSGLAMAGYLLSGAMSVASRSYVWWSQGWANFGATMGMIVLPFLGILTATATFSARRIRTAALAR